MEKRVEQRKKRSEEFRHKLKKAIAVFFCLSLLVFLINAADMSTRRMIMCSDDKYAMAVSLQGDKMLRLDIAGEKLMIDIEPAIRVTEVIASNSKKYFDIISKAIRAKLGT